MARSDTEAMLGANLPRDFVDIFWTKAMPGSSKASKAQVVLAMANAWVDMPNEVKKHYLFPEDESDGFDDVIDAKVRSAIKKMLPELTKSILSEIKGYNLMDEALKDAEEDRADNVRHSAG